MPNELKPCPVCGAKAFLHKDEIDGNFMGYSVGCPRYCIGDGIHGINSRESDLKGGYAFHGISTKQKAKELWNRRADNA